VLFNDEDKALDKNLHQFKEYSSQRLLTKLSGEKLKKRMTEQFTEKDFKKRKHRPKAQQRQTEACAYCSEHDCCG